MELISWLEGGLFALLFFFVWDLFNSNNIRGKSHWIRLKLVAVCID